MPGSPALYCADFPWGSVAVNSIQELMGSVANALSKTGLYTGINTQANGTLVECRTATTNNAIFCVGSNAHHTVAVVTSAGDDASHVKNNLVATVKGIEFL